MSKKLGDKWGEQEVDRRRYANPKADPINRIRVALLWEANDHLFQLDLDARNHLTAEQEREHFGESVMPFDTELDLEHFADAWPFDNWPLLTRWDLLPTIWRAGK